MWELVNQTVIDWVKRLHTNLDVELVGSIRELNATGRTGLHGRSRLAAWRVGRQAMPMGYRN